MVDIKLLVTQATTSTGRLDLQLYTNLVLLEACRLVKETPTTSAYTTFDEGVAITQRADCFKQIYNQISESIENGNS